jgi:hypothetical protein
VLLAFLRLSISRSLDLEIFTFDFWRLSIAKVPDLAFEIDLRWPVMGDMV